AFVVGGRVIGAIERSAPGWKTNLARGGRARAVTLEPERRELALAAARAVGADYAGVDPLPARDGTGYVVEVNGIPGWGGPLGAVQYEPRPGPAARPTRPGGADARRGLAARPARRHPGRDHGGGRA